MSCACNCESSVVIKFKATSEKAKLPKRNNESTDPNSPTGDTGYDIYGIQETIVPAHGSAIVPTGIKVAYITPGYWWKVESRSGLSFKHGVLCHPGIIDNQYRGDTGVKLYNHSDKEFLVAEGERIAQLAVYKLIEPQIDWADEVDETVRGESGFGSSGKH